MLNELNTEIVEKLNKVEDYINGEYVQIMAGGAHPSLLSKIKVEYYGDLQSIQNVANINVLDFETLMISPYDTELVKDIARVISQSNLGINPMVDGKVIRIHVPKITEERRNELVKKAKSILEEAKIKVRNIRKDINNKIKNNNDLSENEQDLFTSEIQKLIEDFNKKLDDIYKQKEGQLLKV